MDCFCGCGIKLARRLTEANLVASPVALELLAWDKVRSEGRLGADAADLESLIARGENSYQRLILLLHGEGRGTAVAEAEAWLEESKNERAGRPEIEEGGGIPLISRPKLRLGEADYEQLDRKHPSQSFSRTDGRLQRLVQLHAEGVLSDDEFRSAKERLVGGA
jgi:hypothetical protein